jgi:hypothetical protein
VATGQDSDQQLGHGHLQGFRDVEQPLVEQSPTAMLYVDEHISSDTGLQRKGLLRHASGGSEVADVPADTLSPTLPLRNPLRVVLTGAGRHALK